MCVCVSAHGCHPGGERLLVCREQACQGRAPRGLSLACSSPGQQQPSCSLLRKQSRPSGMVAAVPSTPCLQQRTCTFCFPKSSGGAALTGGGASKLLAAFKGWVTAALAQLLLWLLSPPSNSTPRAGGREREERRKNGNKKHISLSVQK